MVKIILYSPAGERLDWLRDFDVDANDGRGAVEMTRHEELAMEFTSLAHAFKVWNTVSTVRPLRPDGKPNKPLTAYSAEFVT